MQDLLGAFPGIDEAMSFAACGIAIIDVISCMQ